MFHITIEHPKYKAAHLTRGEQRKVLIGKWLSIHPQILILHDITSGLDEVSRQEIYHILKILAKQGVSIIVMSHNTREMLSLVERVLVVKNGMICKELSGPDVTSEKITKEVYS